MIEVAWKKLQGDVLRTPDYPAIFAVVMGIGLQVFCLVWLFLLTMTVISTNLFFRPVLFLLAFLYSALTSWVNGFTTAKVMKYFGATDWLFAAISAAVVFPALTYAILLAVDCVEYAMRSTARTPPLTIFILGILWICISVPLCFNGAYTAFKQERPKSSIRVN